MTQLSPLQIRLKQATDYLKREHGLKKQDIAKKMNMTDVSFSRAIARCGVKIDENFLISFHAATENVFSLKWLMSGAGSMFDQDVHENDSTPPWVDSIISLVTTNVTSTEHLIRRNMELQASVEMLRRELQSALAEIKTLAKNRPIPYVEAHQDISIAAEPHTK